MHLKITSWMIISKINFPVFLGNAMTASLSLFPSFVYILHNPYLGHITENVLCYLMPSLFVNMFTNT